MPDPRLRPRVHLKPGQLVQHQTHGIGRVLQEWGPVEVISEKSGKRVFTHCSKGVYDVQFGRAPYKYLHCCRGEFLERVL